MFGQYKRITNRYEAGRTHRQGTDFGGSLVRTEATGYGATFFVNEMLKARKDSFDGKTCLVSGSGNVAIYTIEKIHQLGGKVVACSDSNGVIYDEKGIDVELVKQLKEVQRRRIKDYAEHLKHAKYIPSGNIWDIPCHVAMPSATQNEINGKDAKKLVERLHSGRGRGEHAHYAGRGKDFPRCENRLWTWQGGQCRRCGHFSPGDAAECVSGCLDL